MLKPLRETAEAISRELGFTVREASGKDHILQAI
ncbi:transcriptional regulator [Klebsiella variicola]|nr:transcriptional regulator [Klebsiella variicola]